MMLSQLLTQNGRTGGRRPARSTLVRVWFRVYELAPCRGTSRPSPSLPAWTARARSARGLAINGSERRGREGQSPATTARRTEYLAGAGTVAGSSGRAVRGVSNVSMSTSMYPIIMIIMLYRSARNLFFDVQPTCAGALVSMLQDWALLMTECCCLLPNCRKLLREVFIKKKPSPGSLLGLGF